MFPSDPNLPALCYAVLFPVMNIKQKYIIKQKYNRKNNYVGPSPVQQYTYYQRFKFLNLRTVNRWNSTAGGILMTRVKKDLRKAIPKSRQK